MKKIHSSGLPCDYHQFYVLDANADFEEVVDDFSIDDVEMLGTQKYVDHECGTYSIFSTVGQSYMHWLDVFTSKAPPDVSKCDQAVTVPMYFPSGCVLICDGVVDDYTLRIPITPGKYCVFVLGYNLDRDFYLLSEEEKDAVFDDIRKLEQYRELERYEIVLVPGACQKEGLLHTNQPPLERG